MPYAEIDAEGNIVQDEEGNKNIIEDLGSWDHVKGQIPEEFKESKLWENIPDTGTLLKNYAHAQKRMGSAINIPGEDATPEERDAFFAKLGRPESVEEYGVDYPELPEGMEWDEQAQTGFLAAAHKAGLNKGQVNEILGWYADWQRDLDMEGSRAIGDVEAELQKEWGANYETNLALAQRAVNKLGGSDFQHLLDSTGMGNNPMFIKVFNRVGKMMAEDGIIPAQVEGAATSNQAQSKISQIMADASHPYHTGDKEAVAEMRRLYEIAYG